MKFEEASSKLHKPFLLLALLSLSLCHICGQAASSDVSEDPCSELHHRLVNYTSQATKRTKKFVFARPSEVINCTASLEFKLDRDLGTLESIIKIFRSFYSLLHVAKSSPHPSGLPSKYDVIKELEKLKSPEWTSAEEFYGAVLEAIEGLNDGHTGMDLSCPPFRHRLALPLVGVVEGGQHVVRTVPEILLIPVTVEASYLPPFEFDPTPYTGAKVLTIDGEPAWEFMVDWAGKNSHAFHNLGQKLNYAFAHWKWLNGTRSRSYGVFGTRSRNPGSDFVRLKLLREGQTETEQVDVPWLSYTPAAGIQVFKSSETYAKFCLAKKETKAKELPVMNKNDNGIVKQEAEEAETLRKATAEAISSLLAGKGGFEISKGGFTNRGQSGANNDVAGGRMAEGSDVKGQDEFEIKKELPKVPLRMVLFKGTPKRFRMKSAKVLDLKMAQAKEVSGKQDYWKVYKLSDGKTAVVCLSNFYPSIPATDSSSSYFKLVAFFLYETAKALYTADVHGERIIIDLSRNGGGATIVIPWVMELILGSFKFPQPRSEMQNLIHFMADTELVKQLREKDAGSYSWQGWANASEVPFTEDNKEDFFYPIKQLKFGPTGDPGHYSSFFKEISLSLSELMEMPLRSAWGDKPFMLFSDGQCFSACSSFAILMKAHFNVKMVTVGGLGSQPMAFSAAGGGFVTENVEEDIIKAIPKDLRRNSEAPQEFGVPMVMALRWTNGFVKDSSDPIEFTFVPGDHEIQYTMASIEDPSLLYLEAAKLF